MHFIVPRYDRNNFSIVQ